MYFLCQGTRNNQTIHISYTLHRFISFLPKVLDKRSNDTLQQSLSHNPAGVLTQTNTSKSTKQANKQQEQHKTTNNHTNMNTTINTHKRRIHINTTIRQEGKVAQKTAQEAESRKLPEDRHRLNGYLHPVSVRRFPSFRTQPLENPSHYL